MKQYAFILLATLLGPGTALGQSSPGFSYGQVPTAGQWNAAFAAKQDRLTFTPLNQAGGTMTGKLQTAPSTINGAGFSILPGIAPTAPSAGDIWTTTGGLFFRSNSKTLSLPDLSNVAITGGAIDGTAIGQSNPAQAAFTTLYAAGLTLGTPLPFAQGGCGATSLLGCLANLGLAGGTAGNVLTSNGSGLAPTFQPVTPGTGALRYDASQSLTAAQQDQVRVNISGPVSASPSASATLAISDIDRPLFPTGTITLTAANGGAGWRTGPIRNSNATSGLVTLAVPSGATLDGITNGTTVLNPYQKARIIQTGASTYITDWIDRTPEIARVAITSAAALVNVAIPSGYTSIDFNFDNLQTSASGNTIFLRLSSDGTTFKSTASDYYFSSVVGDSSGTNGGNAIKYFGGVASLELAPSTVTTSMRPSVTGRLIHSNGSTAFTLVRYNSSSTDSNGFVSVRNYTAVCSTIQNTPVLALQVGVTSGNIVGGLIVLRGNP